LQAVLVEIYRAEVFAIAAVLPLELDRGFSLTLEVDLAEQVAAILTLDGTLARSEKSSFVFGAKYSHFRSSLQRRVTVHVVLGTKHDIGASGEYGFKDDNNWREVCACAHRLRSTGKFCNPLDRLRTSAACCDKLSRFWTSGKTGGRRL
jgi:hypothetical protein